MLKKFNKYMLENHPLTWHTKFIPLLVAGLVFWLISFISGYVMTDMEVLNTYSTDRFYDVSNFISFHGIFCLIVICLWAFYFYKNSAFRSFYPLQRFYLIRVFLQLLIPFTLLLSAYYPFTAGAFSKTNVLLSEKEIISDSEKMNLAYPFLMTDSGNYDISNRVYPSPFPLQTLTYKSNEDNGSSGFYYNPLSSIQSPVLRTDLEADKYYPKDSANMIVIDKTGYRFFTVRERFEKDSCRSYTYIDSFYNVSAVPNLYSHSMYNFSKLFTSEDGTYPTDEQLYKRKYAPTIHNWLDQKNEKAILNILKSVEEICRKYEVKYDLSPEILLKYMQLKDFHHLHSIVSSYETDRKFSRDEPDYQVLQIFENQSPKMTLYSDSEFIYALENSNIYYINGSDIRTVFYNFNRMKTQDYSDNILIVVLFMAFFLSALFLLFEFTKIISLLISIPVGGVIMILCGIIILNLPHRRMSDVGPAFIVCVALLILLLTILGVYRNFLPRKILDILINLGYFLAPCIISMIIGVYLLIDRKHVIYGRCLQYISDDRLEYFLHPALILVYAFIGLCAYLMLIKRWKALEE